jgi:hypothetical protein
MPSRHGHTLESTRSYVLAGDSVAFKNPGTVDRIVTTTDWQAMVLSKRM